MHIFGDNSIGIKAYGPMASVNVSIGSLVGDNWFLTDFKIGAKEIVDVRQCFNDISVVYALGNSQSQCAISLVFAVFLGSENCAEVGNNWDGIKSAVNEYKSNRISKNKSRRNITIGGFSTNGWLTGFDVGNADAARGVCYATIHFLMEL
jgi:hypothetical protein